MCKSKKGTQQARDIRVDSRNTTKIKLHYLHKRFMYAQIQFDITVPGVYFITIFILKSKPNKTYT